MYLQGEQDKNVRFQDFVEKPLAFGLEFAASAGLMVIQEQLEFTGMLALLSRIAAAVLFSSAFAGGGMWLLRKLGKDPNTFLDEF